MQQESERARLKAAGVCGRACGRAVEWVGESHNFHSASHADNSSHPHKEQAILPEWQLGNVHLIIYKTPSDSFSCFYLDYSSKC